MGRGDDIRNQLLQDRRGLYVRCPYNPQLNKKPPVGEIKLSKIAPNDTLLNSRGDCLEYMTNGMRDAKKWCAHCPNRKAVVVFEPIGKTEDFAWLDTLIDKLRFTFGQDAIKPHGRIKDQCCPAGHEEGVVVVQTITLNITREQRLTKDLAKSVYKVIMAESKAAKKKSPFAAECVHVWLNEIRIGLSHR